MEPVDTSAEAREAAKAAFAAADAAYKEAVAAATEAWRAASTAAVVAYRQRVLLSMLQDSMPATAARVPPDGWVWRTPSGLPRFLGHANGRSAAASCAAHVGPGPEIEGRVPNGRKWRTLAELGPRQPVAEWRVKR